MKKKSYLWAAAVAAAFVPAAHAQSSVTVYGLVDVAVEHVGKTAAAGGINRMAAQTGTLPSRVGFRGSEDLGGGLKAVFTLEQGFDPGAGTLGQGGRLFGRQSFVGLSGSWGTVTLGRQYTMLFWSMLDADIMGPNIYGAGSLDSYIPNARADNAIAYRGTFDGFTVGATYSLGRDTVNASSPAGTNCPGEGSGGSQACREWSVLAKYDTKTWGAAFAVDEMRGAPGAFAGLSSSDHKDRRVVLNGYWKTGALKVGGGLIRRDNDGSATTPKSNLFHVGAAYAISPQLSVDGMLATLKFKNSANKATLFALRGTYSLSKRTALYATVGSINNDGTLALSVSGGQPGSNPVAGGSQTAYAVGIRHAF